MNNNPINPDNKQSKISTAKAFNPPRIAVGVFLVVFFSVFLGVGSWFLTDMLFMHHYNWVLWQNLVISSVFIIGGGVSGGFAIRFLVRQIRKKRFQKRVIANGESAIGLVFDYKCRKIIKHHSSSRGGGSNTTVYYEVSFNYSYVNSLGKSFVKTFAVTLNYDPQLYSGSKIMLAIDGDDAVILDKFTLLPQAEEELKNMAAAEDRDNFSGLDKIPPQIDRKSIGYTAEFSHVKFWAGITLAIFTLVPIGIFIWVFSLFDIAVVNVIVGIMAFLSLVPLISASCFFIISGKKSKAKERRVLPVCRFAWANINIPTGVYSSKSDRRPSFCFIDANGNKRSYKISGSTARKLITQGSRSVAAYTDTEALLLIQYQARKTSGKKRGRPNTVIQRVGFSAAQRLEKQKAAEVNEKKRNKKEFRTTVFMIVFGLALITVAIGVFFGYCRPFTKFENYECVVKNDEWFDLEGDKVKVVYYVDGERYENILHGDFGSTVPFCYNVDDPNDIMANDRGGLIIFMPIVAVLGIIISGIGVWGLKKNHRNTKKHGREDNKRHTSHR